MPKSAQKKQTIAFSHHSVEETVRMEVSLIPHIPCKNSSGFNDQCLVEIKHKYIDSQCVCNIYASLIVFSECLWLVFKTLYNLEGNNKCECKNEVPK